MAVHVVVGGQFGSEGKGAFTGALSKKIGKSGLTAVRVGGPNAGHTVLDEDQQEWKLRQVPVAAVTRQDASLVIAAGSEVDLDVLAYEVALLDAAGFDVSRRLYVDRQATLIGGTDAPTEHALIERIGSTGKGIGAARASRIWREAELYGDRPNGTDTTMFFPPTKGGDKRDILIEGTQGFGLGLHAGYYPFCTSRDCRSIDFLAEAGVNPWHEQVTTWVTFRPYPIRVAGNSGPMHYETSWEVLASRHGDHIGPERTTVTQKIRRVGEWDPGLAIEAMRANGGPSQHVRAVMMMADYVVPDLYGLTSKFHMDTATETQLLDHSKVWSLATGPISAYGTGPASVMFLELP